MKTLRITRRRRAYMAVERFKLNDAYDVLRFVRVGAAYHLTIKRADHV